MVRRTISCCDVASDLRNVFRFETFVAFSSYVNTEQDELQYFTVTLPKDENVEHPHQDVSASSHRDV